MSRQNMLRSTILLTSSGILAKSIDFIFRAYYSRQLGSEGMGIFSLCLTAFNIMLNIASGGLGLAVSKTVSECYSKADFAKAKSTMRFAICIVLVLSLSVILFTVVFSKEIAEVLLKEPRCQMGVIFIAPSILFMGISYCIKGYFYAARKVIIPASSEFIEQAVKVSSISFLLSKMLPYGVDFGCTAVLLGLSVGEFSSCLYLLIFYRLKTRHIDTGKVYKKQILLSIFRISLPVMISSLLGSFLRMKESVLVVSSLKKSGLLQEEALSVYGEIHGMVMPLVVFPLTLLSSCFTLLVPEISRAYALKNQLRLHTLISRLYRFCALFGFFVLCVFNIFGEELSIIVYNSIKISSPLKLISLIAPMMFIDSVSAGILNGMGKQSRLLIFNLLDSGLRLLLIYLLMPKYGVSGFILVILFSNAFTLCLTHQSVTSLSKINLHSSGRLWRYIAATVFVSLASRLILPCSASPLEIAFEMLVVAVFYFVVAILTGTLKKDDIKWLCGRMFF